jgi:serine phosphatase RsbU (regulator of sigma subunit)
MPTPPAAEEGTAKPSRWRRRYFEALAGVILAAALAKGFARDSDAATLLVVLATLAASPLVIFSVRWLWRKLTYRVGVRLFLSYLLVGLTPFALCTCLALLAGYVAIGQYGAVRVREAVEREEASLGSRASAILSELRAHGLEGGRRMLDRQRAAAGGGTPGTIWLLADGASSWSSPERPGFQPPRWAPTGSWRGTVILGGEGYLAVSERDGGRIVAAIVPLDARTAQAFVSGGWFTFRFLVAGPSVSGPNQSERLTIAVRREEGGRHREVQINGRIAPASEIEPGWLDRRPSGGSFWSRLRVIWFWEMSAPHAWESGEALAHTAALTLIAVSPRDGLRDFLGISGARRGELVTVFRAAATVFGVLYFVAVGFAAVMILRITRSTARLTRGARAVARGDFDHRVAVKRHDQLGDLAASFNSMSESVRSMLVQVAERERMAREVELAREIQSSLLPPSELSSGPLAVVAYFRPAAEVGGDYFDLFPIAPGCLAVAIGDVAGHGLPTGLLMAMVKSAVAALIEEGHRGVDLLVRLNHLLLGQSLRQRMVSFALAEIDAAAARVEITSAGHPPGMLLAADGGVEEVLTASLPLGHRWTDPPAATTRPFPPGTRLLLYSDGLVEARNASGAAFGYEALRALLASQRAARPHDLLAAILAELDRHLAGQPLSDDLTVLLVEHAAAPSH